MTMRMLTRTVPGFGCIILCSISGWKQSRNGLFPQAIWRVATVSERDRSRWRSRAWRRGRRRLRLQFAGSPSSTRRSSGAKLTVTFSPCFGGGAFGLLKVSSETAFSLKRTRMRTTEPRKFTSSMVPSRRLRLPPTPFRLTASGRSATERSAPAARVRHAARGDDLLAVDGDPCRALAFSTLALQDVQRADEGGDEARLRPVVDLERRADLLRPAAVHHHDAVGDRQRLFLVVRHEDRGDAEVLLDLADLLAQRHAHLGVERGKRLVEQQHLRLRRERAGERHALLLAAGELVGKRSPSCGRLISFSISATRCSVSAFGTLATFRPKAMFCATVRLGNSA